MLGKMALTKGLNKANSQSKASNEFGLMRKAREQTMNDIRYEIVDAVGEKHYVLAPTKREAIIAFCKMTGISEDFFKRNCIARR